MKIEVKQNLLELETAGMVSSENNYEALICRIAQDIRNQRKHRQRRQKELAHLKDVAKVLENKKNLLQEQVGYYNEYVKACLDGLNSKANKSKSKNPFKRHKDVSRSSSTKTIKYTGAKLFEKGVLLEIDGLQQNQ
jgi:vacuolar-type H+-ATPase subunit E/Vma4